MSKMKKRNKKADECAGVRGSDACKATDSRLTTDLKSLIIVAVSHVRSVEIVQICRSVPAWNCKFQLCNLSLCWLFAKVSLTGTTQEMM